MDAQLSGSVPVITAPLHEGHAPAVEVQCGRALPAFDAVRRMDALLEGARAVPGVDVLPPAQGLDVAGALARVHEEGLLRFLESAWELAPRVRDDLDLIFADTFLHPGLDAPRARPQASPSDGGAFGERVFDTITGIGPRTWSAAVGSVTSALTAAQHVLQGSALAVALCRPPGHHVTRSVFGGGCYLNNAAVTAQWLRDHDVAKVAVVDVDFHHGNGTQSLFYERADVTYSSLHGDPRRCYPYYTGHADERGAGEGLGATTNVPLPAGTTGVEYLDRLAGVMDGVASSGAEAVVVSLGFDTHRDDVSGDALLDAADYAGVGSLVAGVGLPVVAVLEGGYAVPSLGEDLRQWITAARRATGVDEDGVRDS